MGRDLEESNVVTPVQPDSTIGHSFSQLITAENQKLNFVNRFIVRYAQTSQYYGQVFMYSPIVR